MGRDFHIRKNLALVITMAIEVVVLILILLVLLLGLVGIFLPILPGIFFIGIGVALYGLVLRSDRAMAIRKIHPVVKAIGEHFGPFIHNSMLFMRFKKFFDRFSRRPRDEQYDKDEILKNGLILGAFNLALVVAMMFTLTTLHYLNGVLTRRGVPSEFTTLTAIFSFGAISAVLWYRFGLIIGPRFRRRKTVNAALTVLVSIIPLLGIFLSLVNFYAVLPAVPMTLALTTLLSFIYVTVLAVIFEVALVTFGVRTKR